MISSLNYFTTLVQEANNVPLFEAALAIAQDAYPALDLNAPQVTMDRFAYTLRQRMPAEASQIKKLQLLNQFFFKELGFSVNVNNYYDPDNSYLQCVINKRRGIPISLAIVYMELAQQIGLPIQGVSFPGHFLMKLSVTSGDIVIDPLNGISLTHEQLEERLEPYLRTSPLQSREKKVSLQPYLQGAHPHEILVRMLHNLKVVFMQSQQWQKLLTLQQRLLVLLPNDAIELRDRGAAYAHLDCPQAALDDIESYLMQRPHAEDAVTLREQSKELRKACKRLN
ncbi:SirB1 family protein [Glaciimonas immobilis]|uniref:Regulator of sirC expression with transglutaminase-like and TPR domain n=1 Tax=Glaciimonas immobilis TaxID=728004 RepID=A0A840RYS7_9BURK|nr:SirB1 family protein [Glaciimonas immobilis]KAF3998482.1 tetratricopeptide repeat protein [Glaciimonas immobilis]MBB5202016.1 regulator of sirC expression with transglutaminase-like and TPR domain [Glaciimonas immobilis]